MLMKGPETIIFDYDYDDDDFSIYTLTEEGNLIQLSNVQPKEVGGSDLMATTTLIANLGIGRPLGGCFVPKRKQRLQPLTMMEVLHLHLLEHCILPMQY